MMKLILIFSFVISNEVDLISYYDEEIEDVYEPQCDIDYDGEVDCREFLSFASTNWHQKDYRGCIDQYKVALYCNCEEGNELEIYKYLGRAYTEIEYCNKLECLSYDEYGFCTKENCLEEKKGILDSASWAFEKGLRFNPDDEALLEITAWNAGKLKNYEDQMYYLDRLLEINPKNTKALERMSETYKKNEMYEEQINILNLWLKIDSGNQKALSDKKNAYSKLGIDEISIDKDRWEKDKSNLEFGLDYAESLLNKDENETALKVCNELLVFDENNKRLLKTISNIYLNLYEDIKALEYLEKLGQIDKTDLNLKIEISDVAMNAGEFKKAYQWINQLISSGKLLGKAFHQRAEVLVALAENYQSDEIDFCDKLVFDLAFEDYASSYENGYLEAKQKMNVLIDYESLTEKKDWFVIGDEYKRLSPGSEVCKQVKKSDCYVWLDRIVESKNK